MSYLLETLGRGLLGRLLNAFERQLPPGCDHLEVLESRRHDACTSFDLTMQLGAAYLHETRLADARRIFSQAQELSGPAHLPPLGLACVHDELGQTDGALKRLQEAFTHEPRDSSISFGVGLCFEQLERREEAAEAYRNAIDLCPNLRNAYERLAAIAIRNGEWSTARECYSRLAELDPDDLDILLPLANLQLQEGRPAEAAETFQQTLLIEPEATDEGSDQAAEFEDDGRLLQAISTVEKLVDKYPGVTEFRVHLADLYVKAGDDEGAVTQYNAALDLHPSFLEATVKLGTQHLRRQRYEDAAQAFNQAVELNDRLLTAFVGLGVSQHAAGQTQDAHATFDLAASLAPNSTLLFSETNRLHLKARRYRSVLPNREDPEAGRPQDELLHEAILRHQQVLVLHRCRADLHYRHGMLQRQVGAFEAAAQSFQEAVALNPAYAKALIKLGISWRELGRPEEALEAFTRAMRLDQRQVDVHYRLGLLYAQYHQFDLALERFETTLTGQKGAIAFRHNVALALQNIGMIDRADATWHSVCELTRGNDSDLGSDRIQLIREALDG